MIVYEMEVDVALRRPPTPANCRTTFLTLLVEEGPSLTSTDIDATLLAAQIGQRHGVMVTAVRIVGVEL